MRFGRLHGNDTRQSLRRAKHIERISTRATHVLSINYIEVFKTRPQEACTRVWRLGVTDVLSRSQPNDSMIIFRFDWVSLKVPAPSLSSTIGLVPQPKTLLPRSSKQLSPQKLFSAKNVAFQGKGSDEFEPLPCLLSQSGPQVGSSV